jgi:putative membrane protein
MFIMWGCDYIPFSGGWWGGFFPGSLLSLLVWGLFLLLIVSLAVRIIRPQANNAHGSSKDRIDSQTILKARFAKGEISQEEFIKMKQILSHP